MERVTVSAKSSKCSSLDPKGCDLQVTIQESYAALRANGKYVVLCSSRHSEIILSFKQVPGGVKKRSERSGEKKQNNLGKVKVVTTAAFVRYPRIGSEWQ